MIAQAQKKSPADKLFAHGVNRYPKPDQGKRQVSLEDGS